MLFLILMFKKSDKSTPESKKEKDKDSNLKKK